MEAAPSLERSSAVASEVKSFVFSTQVSRSCARGPRPAPCAAGDSLRLFAITRAPPGGPAERGRAETGWLQPARPLPHTPNTASDAASCTLRSGLNRPSSFNPARTRTEAWASSTESQPRSRSWQQHFVTAANTVCRSVGDFRLRPWAKSMADSCSSVKLVQDRSLPSQSPRIVSGTSSTVSR